VDTAHRRNRMAILKKKDVVLGVVNRLRVGVEFHGRRTLLGGYESEGGKHCSGK